MTTEYALNFFELNPPLKSPNAQDAAAEVPNTKERMGFSITQASPVISNVVKVGFGEVRV